MKALAVATLILSSAACGAPCGRLSPSLELRLFTMPQDPSRPMLGAVRTYAGEWSPFLCDPSGEIQIGGLPRWTGDCDLIALNLPVGTNSVDLEIWLEDLSGQVALGTSSADIEACAFNQVDLQLELVSPSPEEIAFACGESCRLTRDCEDAELDVDACSSACDASLVDLDAPCAPEFLSLMQCQAHQTCAWRPPLHDAAASPCRPAQDALSSCEAELH